LEKGAIVFTEKREKNSHFEIGATLSLPSRTKPISPISHCASSLLDEKQKKKSKKIQPHTKQTVHELKKASQMALQVQYRAASSVSTV